MTGDQKNFISISIEKDGNVTFGDNGSAKIVRKGIVSLINGNLGKAQNSLYVEWLKHNILSVSQVCDQGHDIMFHSKYCEMRISSLGKLVGREVRTTYKLYILVEIQEGRC